MREKRFSGAPLVLELLLALLFFALSAAICLQLFVTAQKTGQDSRNLTRAVMAAQNAAECWKAAEGDPAEAAGLLEARLAGAVLTADFDESWAGCDSGIYTLTLTPGSDGSAHICVSGPEGEIFSLTAAAVKEVGP